MREADIREIYDLHARLCKAIADPKRLLIISLLRDGPLTVGEISTAIGSSQSNTSQHLAVLRDRNVVTASRAGNTVHYALRGEKVVQAIELLREFMAEELASGARLHRTLSA